MVSYKYTVALILCCSVIGAISQTESEMWWMYEDWLACYSDSQKALQISDCADELEVCAQAAQTSTWGYWGYDYSWWCNCYSNWLTCLIQTCPVRGLVEYNWAALSAICSQASFLGRIEWHYTFEGDPHFIGPDGLSTCDELDYTNIYTTEKVAVSGHATALWPPYTASALDSITVTIAGQSFTHTLSHGFSGTAPSGYTVSPHRIAVQSTGESIVIHQWANHLDLSVYGFSEGTGLFFTGCATTKKREVIPSNPLCGNLTGSFQEACNYDLYYTGDGNFSMSTNYMEREHSVALEFLKALASEGTNPSTYNSPHCILIGLAILFALLQYI